MPSDVWNKLENTDSNEIEFGDDKTVMNLAREYGRDIKSIINGMYSGARIPAPIILITDSGYYLVAGNTRLMAAKMLGVTPKIWLF